MKRILLLAALILIASSVFSKADMKTRSWRKSQNDSMRIAELMFEDQNFVAALSFYEPILQEHPEEVYLKYKLGICGLFRSDMHEKALQYLKDVFAKNASAEDIEYYLAKAYHYNYQFDPAMEMLNIYMKRKNISAPQKRNAMQLMEYCSNAKVLYAAPVNASIENMGDALNSVAAEYVPLMSSDESVMIFTYRGAASTGGLMNELYQPDPFGEYYEDVFISHKENGNWSTASGIDISINSIEHDAAIALSNDGQQLYIFKYNEADGGDIWCSYLNKNSWSAPEKLRGEINTTYWEGSASISADKKTLYFSSERPGGFGGKDLYRAFLQPDGSWGKVENLGTSINTTLDDDAPFIHPDGKTLLYSSKGLNSMGGFDIFMSKLDAAGWLAPQNLGFPINSTDEDIYFTLSADGKRGYYASGKSGGFGLEDLYMVDMPSTMTKPVVAMIKGTSTLDEKPIEISIEVNVLDTQKPYATYTSNASDGNYLINLEPGHVYQLTYKLANFPDQVQMIDLEDLKEFEEKNIQLNYSTTSTVAKTN